MKEKVIIEKGFANLFANVADFSKRALIVTDTNVYERYGNEIESESACDNMEYMDKIILDSGEQTKSFESAYKIFEKANCMGLDKSWTIIAFGGGVIGDLSGFAASIYKRGVQLIHVPTTLISQIDSSIGGKTGINFGNYKNNIGTIYRSKLTYINVDCLKTLDKRQYVSSFGELAKYAFIAGGEIYDTVFNNTSDILEYNYDILTNLISKCINIKQSIVEKDLNDIGIRNILNLGHTLGHAIESISDYKILHGEAILIGLLYSCIVAKKMNILKENLDHDIQKLIKFLSIKYPKSLITKDLMEYFKADKKFIDGKIRFVLPYALGDIRVNCDIGLESLIAALGDLAEEDFLWI